VGNVWQLTTLGELNAVQDDAVIRNHSSGMHITIIRSETMSKNLGVMVVSKPANSHLGK
jgi:hypothetical protein